MQVQLYPARLGVAGDVGERLLDDAEDGGAVGVVERQLLLVGVQLAVDAVAVDTVAPDVTVLDVAIVVDAAVVAAVDATVSTDVDEAVVSDPDAILK